MAPTILKSVIFDGFEPISNRFPIAAAVLLPANAQHIITSGHIGLTAEGQLREGLEAQVEAAFQVRRPVAYVEWKLIMATEFRTSNCRSLQQHHRISQRVISGNLSTR